MLRKEYTSGNAVLGGFLRRKAKLDSLQGNKGLLNGWLGIHRRKGAY